MRLEDYKNRQPFSTPDGYFEELNKRIATGRTKEGVVETVLDTEGTYGSKN